MKKSLEKIVIEIIEQVEMMKNDKSKDLFEKFLELIENRIGGKTFFVRKHTDNENDFEVIRSVCNEYRTLVTIEKNEFVNIHIDIPLKPEEHKRISEVSIYKNEEEWNIRHWGRDENEKVFINKKCEVEFVS